MPSINSSLGLGAGLASCTCNLGRVKDQRLRCKLKSLDTIGANNITITHKTRVFLNPLFGNPWFAPRISVVFIISVVSVISANPAHSTPCLHTQLLVCSCLSCHRRFLDFRRFRERRPTCKPWVWQTIGLEMPENDYQTELHYFQNISGTSCFVITEPNCFWNDLISVRRVSGGLPNPLPNCVRNSIR